MIVTQENQRFYLRSWEYNTAKVLTGLAKQFADEGAHVEHLPNAVISNSTLDYLMMDAKRFIEKLKVSAEIGNELAAEGLAEYENKLACYEKISNAPISVTHTSYLRFVLDDTYYAIYIDNNPFFPHRYIKTPIKDGLYSADAIMESIPDHWWCGNLNSYDCFVRSINETIARIHYGLLCADNSTIIRDSKRQRIYDDARHFHYETVYAPERFKKIDF